jgi:ADP-ribose pyrophosphatase YjhB (NUDIX family)
VALRAEITVAAVIEHERRFLLVEEMIAGRLVFTQPGGHVEAGESVHDAVVREVLEETAWDFTPLYLLGSYLWTQSASGRVILRVVFAGSVAGHHRGRALDRGIVATHWLTHHQILGHADRLRSPLVLRCVDDYLQGRRLPLESLTTLDGEPAAPDRAANA